MVEERAKRKLTEIVSKSACEVNGAVIFMKKWKSRNKTFVRKDVDTVVAVLCNVHVLCCWILKNKIGTAMSFTSVFQAMGQRHKANLPLCASYQQCRVQLWKTQEELKKENLIHHELG